MDGHDWGFQYSPYAYFNEHCIFLDSQHVPMAISRKTFERLLTIVETFPRLFCRVQCRPAHCRGSILTHDHYQGGRHTFPMELAEIDQTFTIAGFEEIQVGIVRWPMSVVRLQSDNKEELINLADHILESWRGYSDPAVQVLATSDGQPHHTITPLHGFVMAIMNWTWCSVTTKPHQSIQMVSITHMRMCNTSKRKYRPDRSHGSSHFASSSQRRAQAGSRLSTWT